MFTSTRNFFNSSRWRQLTDKRNIVLYIFAALVLAITWSGIKTLQNNYQLQKQISTLQQQNTVTALQNTDAQLQNKYYQTDQYLELAARQDFGLAAPGESVLLVPANVAMKYVDRSISPAGTDVTARNTPGYVKNFDAWKNFLLGRKLFDD